MRTIVVNLPVRKLEDSEAFFSELGFTFNPEFSDDKTACMVVADNAFVMLIEQERFRDFIVGEISDATTTEVRHLPIAACAPRPRVRRNLIMPIAASSPPPAIVASHSIGEVPGA